MNKNKVDLKLDWATHEAAKYACENWHYSGCIPAGTLVKIGAWENKKYIGAIIFGHGSIYEIGSPYGLSQFECVELVRIALNKHESHVSKIMAFAIRMLKKENNKLRLLVSYADPSQNHHGGIYQATNWIYQGQISIRDYISINGVTEHPRSLYAKYGTSSIGLLKKKNLKVKSVKVPGKHKYIFPLDEQMKQQVSKLSKPYPKRVEHENNASSFQLEESGAIPTSTLQT